MIDRYAFVRETDREGIASLVSRTADDVRELARAEIALVKARVAERTSAYRMAAIYFVAAAVLALAMLIALLIGLILTLATLVGPGIATAIVVIAVGAIAGILGFLGSRALRSPLEKAEQ